MKLSSAFLFSVLCANSALGAAIHHKRAKVCHTNVNNHHASSTLSVPVLSSVTSVAVASTIAKPVVTSASASASSHIASSPPTTTHVNVPTTVVSPTAATTSEVIKSASASSEVVKSASVSSSEVVSHASTSSSKAASATSTHTANPTTSTQALTTTSTHAATTTSAAPAPPASGNSGVKRGLSYNDASLLKNFNSQTYSWGYNWASQTSGLPKGVAYFPMLWGTSSDHTSSWTAKANAAIAAGSTHLLGFNEPDLSAQSNLSPAAAAKAWMQYMQPFAGRAKLVSPAITNGPASQGMGTGWMDQFLAECATLGCTVDAIAAHIYADAGNVDYYKSYISGLGKYGKPVVMSELGTSSGSPAQQVALVKELVPFLDGLDTVSHYAWFMAGQNILVSDAGSLTALGAAYQAA